MYDNMDEMKNGISELNDEQRARLLAAMTSAIRYAAAGT